MTNLEEKQLIKIAQSKNKIAAETAMEQLITANIGLVNSIVNQFMSKYDNVEYEDLLIDGQRGLIKAIGKFNLKSKNKLCTFAYLEIFQSIQKGLTERNIVYVPDKQLKLYWSIVAFKKQYYNDHGCYPSIEAIAKALKVTKRQVVKNTKVINQVYSLDKTIDPDKKQTSASTVADDNLRPDEIAIKDEAMAQLYACLKKSLSDKQYQVITWTYGLDLSVGKLQAKDIAKRLKLSVPAVRKIQYGTLALLKSLAEMKVINESFQ